MSIDSNLGVSSTNRTARKDIHLHWVLDGIIPLFRLLQYHRLEAEHNSDHQRINSSAPRNSVYSSAESYSSKRGTGTGTRTFIGLTSSGIIGTGTTDMYTRTGRWSARDSGTDSETRIAESMRYTGYTDYKSQTGYGSGSYSGSPYTGNDRTALHNHWLFAHWHGLAVYLNCPLFLPIYLKQHVFILPACISFSEYSESYGCDEEKDWYHKELFIKWRQRQW
ncbi:hypothetical protein F5051DRAFT_433822 [Lentinula edodes]|nr:hypothetical protein F5051DRAFT_433822 [Lentinula edodes]